MRVELSFPLLGLTDEYGRQIGYSALLGPAHSATEHAQVKRVAAHHRLIGLASYLTFPSWPPGSIGPFARACLAWAHCFHEPDRYLPGGVPRTLLTHSDFTDPQIVDPDKLCPGTVEKIYDFVYVCQPGRARERVKNWDLAMRCLPVLCGKLGLRGLLVGRAVIPDLAAIPGSPRLTVCGELPWTDLMRCFAASRFLFVPNEMDPAPRIIAESLAMDTPVLVNRRILGGWHHVTPFTGAFFNDAGDVATGARRCLDRRFSPRRWFNAHHGPRHAGTRLAQLLRQIDPGLATVRRIHLATHTELPEGA